MEYLFENIKNNIDFFLRNKLTFSRKNYYEKNEDKKNIFRTDLEKEFFENLNHKYNLEILKNTTKRNFLENLYFLNLFDKIFPAEIKPNAAICDIGSKNWYYAKSEYIFFKNKTTNFKLTGIELDGNRLNSKFYSRYEIAKFHTKNLNDTQYLIKDFLSHNEKFDYIIWILPFISEYPLIKWGLPKKYFCPEKMLSHACNSLNKNGELLIINQGENEYKLQKELNKRMNIQAEYLGEIEDIFNLFSHKRYCSKIKNKDF